VTHCILSTQHNERNCMKTFLLTTLLVFVAVTMSFSQVTFNDICNVVPTAASYYYANNFSLAVLGCDKIMFASSQVYNGNLGGSTGADASCQQLASASGLPGQ